MAQAFERMLGGRYGGGALVVRRRGENLVDIWAGMADRDGRRPWTRDTLALSFSTTKGVASTVIHRLADRGLFDYDDPVAAHWPEFGANGKQDITVRELLSHRAGLHNVRAVASNAVEMLDHLAMEERLAARPGGLGTERPCYHAITYGWLVAGLARGLTDCGMAELVRTEIAEPLAIDGLHIGMPPEGPAAVAEPVGTALRHVTNTARFLNPVWSRLARTRTALNALHVPGFDRIFLGPEPRVLETEMPAVNGVFTADALARLYGALANGGAEGERRLLSPETVEALGRVQTRAADGVLGIRMRWRLGYHTAFGSGRAASRAFGHYGYGGSGGWADPDSGLSLGFVTNKLGSVSSTPIGDYGLFRLSGLAQSCARAHPD